MLKIASGLGFRIPLALLFAITAAAQDHVLTALSLDELTRVDVQTAALHSQSVSSAPGIVTVITAEQIASNGYEGSAGRTSFLT